MLSFSSSKNMHRRARSYSQKTPWILQYLSDTDTNSNPSRESEVSLCTEVIGKLKPYFILVPKHRFKSALGSTKQQDKRQQTETDEVLPEQKEDLYCVSDWALNQVPQRACGVTLIRYIPEPFGHSPVPCAPRCLHKLSVLVLRDQL